MDQQDPINQVPFIENLQAPEVFAAEALGFFFNQGNIHITFSTPRSSYAPNNNSVSRVVSFRLVMPIEGAASLASGLAGFIESQRNPMPPANVSQPVKH